MSDVFKVLGQAAPGATTNTDLYTVPAKTFTTVSAIYVCDRAGGSSSFRVAIRPAGAEISNEHYVYYDAPLSGNTTVKAASGLTLASGTIVTVYASVADISFSLFGVETS